MHQRTAIGRYLVLQAYFFWLFEDLRTRFITRNKSRSMWFNGHMHDPFQLLHLKFLHDDPVLISSTAAPDANS